MSSDHNFHTFCYFCFCVFGTVYLFVVCGGLVFLFLVAPSLAVFYAASAFNRDVSKWNTSAVTNMGYSKRSLSLPLCGHSAFHCGVVLNISTATRGSSGYKSLTSIVLFVVVV